MHAAAAWTELDAVLEACLSADKAARTSGEAALRRATRKLDAVRA